MPVDRQSKHKTEKRLLQKQMTKIDIAYRNKVYKTAAFPNMYFFFNQALKKPDHENWIRKTLNKVEVDKANEKLATKCNLHFWQHSPWKWIWKGVLPFRGPQKNRSKETKIV